MAAGFALTALSAAAAESCTAAQKLRREEALAAFKRQLAPQRQAFFRRNPSAAARQAFIERQAAKVRTLTKAARCRVPAARADMTVTMSVAGTTELTFIVSIRNRGPGRARNVTLRDDVPAGAEFVSARATAGKCSEQGGVTCSLRSVANGATVTVTIVFRRYRTGVIENTAVLDSTTADPRPANNSATTRSTNVLLPPSSPGPPCSPSLTFPGPRAYFHLGPTNYDYYLPATGRLGALVLFVDFPDAPQSSSTQSLFADLVPPTAQWYAQASYGRFTFAAETINSWIRMPSPGATYELHYRGDYPGLVARHRAFLQDAVAVADSRVDFSKYSAVVVVAALPNGTSAYAGVPFQTGTGVFADGRELRGVVALAVPLAHAPDLVREAGHLFGLPDLYDFSVPIAEGQRHLGRWEPMSGTGTLSHHLGWVKWKLGWLDASQLRCLTSPGVLEETIAPIEGPEGVKMVVLTTGGTTAEIVEVHTLRGASNQICDSGVIVYRVDVQARSGTVGAHIYPARDDPPTNACGAISRAAFDLGRGELATYENGLMKVELLASDGSSYRVRVTRK